MNRAGTISPAPTRTQARTPGASSLPGKRLDPHQPYVFNFGYEVIVYYNSSTQARWATSKASKNVRVTGGMKHVIGGFKVRHARIC